jgi:parallel beta-helix repeat protein
VDQAGSGDEIRVAEGTYAGVQARNGVTQVVYISKSVTIRGGYSVPGFDISLPTTQKTILDAEGQGRVLYLLGEPYGNITPTIEGLWLTNGRAVDADGGGIYADDVDIVISGCHIYSNTAVGTGMNGGGLKVNDSSGATLLNNHIYSNTAHNGGGIDLAYVPDVLLAGNSIYTNTAAGWSGGGLIADGCDRMELRDNQIYDNRAAGTGGGVWMTYCDDATLHRNQIHDNLANGSAGGGGVFIRYSDDPRLLENDIHHNTCPTTPGADGGGVYFDGNPNAEISDNRIYDNTASDGGGVAIDECHNTRLARNWIYGNTGSPFGGGVFIATSDNLGVVDNEIYSNSVTGYGGGLYIHDGTDASLEGNRIHLNSASSQGGGIWIYGSDNASLTRNHLFDNTSGSRGGGLNLIGSDGAALTGNQLYGNEADETGGAIDVRVCNNLTLLNNMVVDNELTGLTDDGAGVFFDRTTAWLLHNTLARNTGGEGQAIYLALTSTVQLDNSIIVSHQVGIEVADPSSSAYLNRTLWGSGSWANISDTVGSGITSIADLENPPGFHDPDRGDYHITYDSAAKDAAAFMGLSTDVDGDSRFDNSPPDIGADEYGCHVRLNDDPTPYHTVQAAIDASTAPTDVVRVAGACRGVVIRASRPLVARIANTLTVRGGYSTDFSEWNPARYPTTLDALGYGHVVYLYESNARLESLRLVNGWYSFGGGVAVDESHAIISGCQILDSSAAYYGGGLFAAGSDVTLLNTVIADNRITDDGWHGAGVAIMLGQARMLHTTLSSNAGGDGCGVWVGEATLVMTNTILVDHTVGISAAAPVANVILESTLWGSGEWANDTDWAGPGSVSVGNENLWAEPGFVDPDNGNYHLAGNSPAIDQGIDASVGIDMDGHPRPAGLGPDLGADEVLLTVYLPLVLRSH